MQDFRYLKNVATLQLDDAACIGCGLCAIVCPHSVFQVRGRKADIVDLDGCMECGACQRNCPVNAIHVNAGVGCASAIIYSWLTGNPPSCDCGSGDSCC